MTKEKWQRILLAKNEQINYFRKELDNMMEVITKLQAQVIAKQRCCTFIVIDTLLSRTEDFI